MIKRTSILTSLLLLTQAVCHSQTLSNQVLVPAGNVKVSGSINYSQTIGETAIEIIGSSGYVFTQGFQQPGIKEVPGTNPPGTGVDVYPNPATEYINVKLFGDVARKFTIEIINITGNVISSSTIEFTSNFFYIKQFDVTWLKLGLYFIRVSSADLKINRIFKIEKM